MKPITDPDTTREDKAYWEQVLASHGLQMSAGSASRRVTPNVGTIQNLVRVEQAVFEKGTGKVKPSGHGPSSYD